MFFVIIGLSLNYEVRNSDLLHLVNSPRCNKLIQTCRLMSSYTLSLFSSMCVCVDICSRGEIDNNMSSGIFLCVKLTYTYVYIIIDSDKLPHDFSSQRRCRNYKNKYNFICLIKLQFMGGQIRPNISIDYSR